MDETKDIFQQEIEKNQMIIDRLSSPLSIEKAISIDNRLETYIFKTLQKENNIRTVAKISPIIKDNTEQEVEILTKINNILIKNISPHFVYNYYNHEINNLKLKKMFENTDISNYKIIIDKDSSNGYYIYLNEFFEGDLNDFLKNIHYEYKLILNVFLQIFISILSYHSIGYLHNDAHLYNFLYKKVEKGGYIKYNIFGKTLYLENLGFIWAIWDFETSRNINIKQDLQLTNNNYIEDYYCILLSYKSLLSKNIISLTNDKINDIKIYLDNLLRTSHSSDTNYEQLIFEYLAQYFDTPTTTDKIINENAYVIPFTYVEGGKNKSKRRTLKKYK